MTSQASQASSSGLEPPGFRGRRRLQDACSIAVPTAPEPPAGRRHCALLTLTIRLHGCGGPPLPSGSWTFWSTTHCWLRSATSVPRHLQVRRLQGRNQVGEQLVEELHLVERPARRSVGRRERRQVLCRRVTGGRPHLGDAGVPPIRSTSSDVSSPPHHRYGTAAASRCPGRRGRRRVDRGGRCGLLRLVHPYVAVRQELLAQRLQLAVAAAPGPLLPHLVDGPRRRPSVLPLTPPPVGRRHPPGRHR